MPAIVYVTTNLVNGKRYLGKSDGKNPNYLGSGKLIKCAIRKYGRVNFSRSVVAECATEKEAYEVEEKFSREWNVVNNPNWYNMRYGGEGSNSGSEHPDYGKKHSQERKLKNSVAQKNSIKAQNNVRKLIAMGTGIVHTDDYKNNMSIICGKSAAVQSHMSYLNKEFLTAENRRQSTLRTLEIHPELVTHLRSISGNRKGITQTPEHIQKRSEARRGIKHKIITCPHCGNVGGHAIMKRWHFENCKHKGVV